MCTLKQCGWQVSRRDKVTFNDIGIEVLQEGKWFSNYSNSTINASINHKLVLCTNSLALW